jgi:hypothetical protein
MIYTNFQEAKASNAKIGDQYWGEVQVTPQWKDQEFYPVGTPVLYLIESITPYIATNGLHGYNPPNKVVFFELQKGQGETIWVRSGVDSGTQRTEDCFTAYVFYDGKQYFKLTAPKKLELLTDYTPTNEVLCTGNPNAWGYSALRSLEF